MGEIINGIRRAATGSHFFSFCRNFISICLRDVEMEFMFLVGWGGSQPIQGDPTIT